MNENPRQRLRDAIERVEDVPEITIPWLLEAGHDMRLVDIREPHELAEPGQRIDGMEHIPMGDALAQAGHWDPAKPLLLFCRSGARSGRLARELESRGFDAVASVRGGIIAWHALLSPHSLAEARASLRCSQKEN